MTVDQCVLCDGGALNKLSLSASVSVCVFYCVRGVQLVKEIIQHPGKSSHSR